MGEQTEHKYMQMLDIGIRGVKELTFDTTQEVKVTSLTLNSNLTADLPCDYVKYRRIGVYKNQDYYSLGLDENMPMPIGVDGCGNPINRSVTEDTDNLENVYWMINYRGGENTGGIYGLGGGNNENGYYRIDKENNQIVFSSEFGGSSVVVEYISDGSGDSGQYEIHVFAEEALRAYIWWKHLQRRKYIPLQEKESARRDWYNEKRLAVARFSSFNKEEALQTSRRQFRQSPKA